MLLQFLTLLFFVSFFQITQISNTSTPVCRILPNNHICSAFNVRNAIPNDFAVEKLHALQLNQPKCTMDYDLQAYLAFSCYVAADPCYYGSSRVPASEFDIEGFKKFIQNSQLLDLSSRESNGKGLCKRTCEKVVEHIKSCNSLYKFENLDRINLCINLSNDNEKCISEVKASAASSTRFQLNHSVYFAILFSFLGFLVSI